MSTVEKSIDVDVPIAAAYDQWTQFEEFPQFMKGIDRIDQTDDRHLHWVASFGGSQHEWDAEITEQKPEERIAWKSVAGKQNAGVVTFHKLEDAKTRVTLQMEWEPEGIKEKIGSGSGIGIDDHTVQADLDRFKKLIEERGAASGGYRETIPREG